ncbi:MAG: Glu/Leu/Phe/Val dehydrogenase dimerization domain-containing protein [Kiloniellales bacterium]
MPAFDSVDFDDHEQVVFCNIPSSGLRAIIAIHNTARGPAVGGCRMWPYESEDDALKDVLRLSRGMTYKAAIAELPFGGGKSVIIGNPSTDKIERLFRALGVCVESLGGRYIVAEDVGTSPADMEWVRKQTRHVAGIAEGGSGDPSPATAHGVYHGIRAAVHHRLGRDSLDGIAVAVQGLGQVGSGLCRLLAADGVRLVVTDIDAEAVSPAVNGLGASAVEPEAIYGAQVDVFAPCALGAIINDETVPRLKAAIVAGSANNQLAEDRHGEALRRRRILYAPDYVINAGGIIDIAHEGPGYSKVEMFAQVARIHDTLMKIFARAEADGVPTNQAADRLAEQRFKHRPAPHASAAA